jgi:hypothetical protein
MQECNVAFVFSDTGKIKDRSRKEKRIHKSELNNKTVHEDANSFVFHAIM